MNRAAKLGTKSPEEALIKKPSPRNPLMDLNGSSVPRPRVSAEATRRGCFGFLLSSSSTKDSLPKSRTPKSAPPNPRTTLPSKSTNPSKLWTSRDAHKNPSRPSSEKTKQLGSKKPRKARTPDLLQRRKQRKPIWGEQVGEAEDASTGKNADLEVGLVGNGGKVIGLRSGSCSSSTPQKTFQGFSHEMGLEMKEGEQKLSSTPTSTTTPPIQVSISPEIVNGSSVAPTPVCFAAGYVIAGVQDRRKCRPRGILAIGGFGPEVMENLGSSSAVGSSNGSHVSSAPPPITEAAIHWMSSPSKDANAATSGSSCSRVHISHYPHEEASMNWLLSPDDAGGAAGSGSEFSSYQGIRGLGPLNDNATYLSDVEGLMDLNSPVVETPSSGFGIWRTPTTGSSISPFSMILRKAAASSGLTDVKAHKRRGGYRYDLAMESSPISGGNAISTPSSRSSSKKQIKLSPSKMDSIADALETMRLSPERALPNEESDLLPLSHESFKFECPAAPSNSIDLSHFLKPSYSKSFAGKELHLKEQVLPGSEVRISWREGLVSRIFEMGELDCCKWLSDDEDNSNCSGEDKSGFEIDDIFDRNDWSSISKDGNDRLLNGFGSVEFACGEVGAQNGEGKVPPGPISFAESISTEGGDGLISSGDSDWTLFYKNHLFEV